MALAALAGCARRLGRTRGEVVAITLLAWSAFGVLQLAIGYVDVYPTVLALMALYLWAALGALDGTLHPVWALGPDGTRFVPDDPDYNPDDGVFARIHCRVDRPSR